MTVTQTELDQFHEFASQKIATEGVSVSFEDLVVEWESIRDKDAIDSAIRQGLADIKAGRYRSAEEVTDELRQKHGIPSP